MNIQKSRIVIIAIALLATAIAERIVLHSRPDQIVEVNPDHSEIDEQDVMIEQLQEYQNQRIERMQHHER